MQTPFYEKIRPKLLEDMVGQKHIIGKGKLVSKLYESKKLTNLIFYGPPGTGKTTLANILINNANYVSFKLNATYSKTKDIRDILEKQKGLFENKTFVILVDEIHNFNKKQQQLLLEYIEKGQVIMIANTTENPYFHIYKSLLSRTQVVEFKNLEDDNMIVGLKNAIKTVKEKIICNDKVLKAIVRASNGDYRKALSILGLAIDLNGDKEELEIDEDMISNISGSKVLNYDRDSQEHYNLLSAFQKSIRGSNADAAVHYLARLCYAEDIDSITRRLLVIACEDVGLAYPNAITIVKSCVDSAYMLGFPEARIPLAHATVLLSILPKSNSAYMAINMAMADLEDINITDIPKNIINFGNTEYKYPHDYENSYVEQEYMPKAIKNKKYYIPKNNKFESTASEYIKKIKFNK